MPSAAPVPTPGLSPLCEAAARALRCTATLTTDAAAPAWRATFDPATGACAAAPHAPSSAGTWAPNALRLPLPGDGALVLERDAPWDDADQALAAALAASAGAAVAADRRATRLDERLGELERHVDEIQAMASLGSFQWFVAEDRIEWSAEQLRIHGRGEAGPPRDWAEFTACVHPDDLPRAEIALRRLMETGREEVRYRIVRPDGEVRTVHARNSVIRGADGAPVRVVGTVQDVSPQETAERERAERALRESEERFRRLIENAHDLVVVIDADGIARFGSPSVRWVLGYDPATLAGSSVLPLVHPDDLAATRDWLRRLADDPGTTHRTVYRCRHEDGSWRWLEAFGRTLSATSAADGVVANIRDITERKEAERALRASEEQFRRMIENSSDLLLISRGDGRLTYASPSVERLLGWTPDEMVTALPEALLHPDDLVPTMASMRSAADTPGRIHHVDFRVRHRDGGWRRFLALARTLAPDSGDAGVVCNARDITEQRSAEEALQRSEEHFRRLIENGSDLLMIAAPDLALTYVSPSAERLLGYRPEEMLGLRPGDLLHPDDSCAVREHMLRVAEDPTYTARATWRIRHREGGWRVFEALGRRVPLDDGGFGFIVNGRDVTDQRAAEAALQRSEEHFRRLIENGSDLLMISRPDGALTYVSPSVTRLLGHDPEWMIGRIPSDLTHPDDLAALWDTLGRVAAEPGSVHAIPVRLRHADGSWRHLEAIARTVAPDTADEGIVANSRDVTAQRLAEQALQRSEEHFRRLIEHAHDMIVIVDDDGMPVYGSPSVQRVLGVDPRDVDAGATPAPFHPDDAERAGAWLRALADGPGAIHRIEYRLRHRDGHWLHLEAVSAVPADYRRGTGHVVNIRDVTDRRAVEEALQRSEEHFRALIEHSYDLVQVLDATGQVVYTGPSVQRLLGYTPEEIAGGTLADFMHPDDLPAAVQLVTRIVAHPGTSGSLEYRVRHKDGSWRWLEAWARTLSPTSAEQGLVANARDITERREAQEALRASEAHFRLLIENGNDLVMISRTDGSLSYVSPSMKRAWGYDPDWMLGQRPVDLLHPDDVVPVMATLAAAAANPGTVHTVTFRAQHADGSWRVTEVLNSTLLPDSAEAGIMCNMRDITEQRAVEIALQESESRYRSLIEAAQDMITVIDAEGIVKFQSASAARILGFAPEEMIGRNVMEFLHPDDVEMAVQRLSKVVEEPGTVECVQYRSRCKDGSYRYLESTGRTILPDSAAAGAVGIVRDITDRIETEEALRQAKADAERAREEAERANRAKSEFLSRMSHELRTPLNSILGFAQVLEDLELPNEYRGGVRHILNGGRHLLNLINEVLDIARIEAEEQPLSLEPVRVHPVVREAVDMVRPLALARGVQVVDATQLAADRYVRADRQRLVQVLLNLLSNAVKYNRPGGEVRIGAQVARDADGVERVRLRVRDEGIGIPADRRDQLFVPFARLGAERTGIEGTGLGLALSQRLARAMGGALSLERSDAQGSVFAVELLATPNPLADAPTLVFRAERMGGGAGAHAAASLLYIEDNLANLSLVETILLPRPEWRVIPALQGRMGLELAVEHAPDVVLLDLHLPDMHGADVLRHLRADARTAAIPVVIVSADATPRTIETLTAAGADAFLTKPLDVRAFLQTVERLLVRRVAGG